jgi:glycosyltransferase involved in cell wall biosynthesis
MCPELISRPRTVLLLTPSSRLLGARRSLLALAESLDLARWRPVVCSQSFGQLGEECVTREIPMEVLNLGWWRKGKYFLWRPFAISRLAALARSIGADLIHCNEIYPNPYAIRAALNVPTPEGSPLEGRPIPVVTHVRLNLKPGMIRKYDLGRASRIITVSESIQDEFEEWPDRQERVSVIYNGVNLKEFQRSRNPEEARELLELPKKGFMICAPGQLGPRKGGDIVLDAFERLASQHQDIYLVLVGDPHKGQEKFGEMLRQRAGQSDMAGRVFIRPFTENIIPYYEAADVNLLISRKEGFGRTIIEAAAVGVPSIGADVGGISEIITPKTGILVPPENPEALAGAILRLKDDMAERRQMTDLAFRHIARYFSSNVHVERIMDLYDEVLIQSANEE